ncbi:MAG: nuclease [Patescibacteria group bacterium]|nr:nuclease [Patescibacteria group bacterium]
MCKKLIYKRPSQIHSNNGKVFCSTLCYGVSCRKETPCLVCGKLILAGLHKKTCSRACSNKNRAGIIYKVKKSNSEIKSQEILKVRLLKIRGLNCERCSYKKYEILHIHHKDRDRSNNNLNNLELICPNCHFEEHYSEKSWLKRIF